MICVYGETFAVDLAHADVAYSLFDAWKALGRKPNLTTSEMMVAVGYIKTCITIDKKEETDEQS